jgi:hypothetical protein
MLLEEKNAVICGVVAGATTSEQTHPQRTGARRMSI